MAPTLFEKEPKPGDLIEIFRGSYQHWAVYVGGYEVIHLIPLSEQDGGLFSLMASDRAQVRCQRLCDVVGSDRFRVNNEMDERYTPRQPGLIIREARRLEWQIRPYSFISNNCEHFVTELRYGRPESQQVREATEAAVIGGVAVVGAVALGALLFRALLKDDDKDNHRRRHNRWQ